MEGALDDVLEPVPEGALDGVLEPVPEPVPEGALDDVLALDGATAAPDESVADSDAREWFW